MALTGCTFGHGLVCIVDVVLYPVPVRVIIGLGSGVLFVEGLCSKAVPDDAGRQCNL